jgi:hypothetical protein
MKKPAYNFYLIILTIFILLMLVVFGNFLYLTAGTKPSMPVYERIYNIALSLLFILMLILYLLDFKINGILRNKNPEKWRALDFSWHKFLAKKEYLQLNNPELTRLSELRLKLENFYMIYFIIVIIYLFVTFILDKLSGRF